MVNRTPSWEGLSQAGNNLGSSQAGRQANITLNGDSATSKEASTSSNNIPSGEGISQAGNNPPSSPVSPQAGRQVVRHSARLRASQASQGNSATPEASRATPQEATLPPH